MTFAFVQSVVSLALLAVTGMSLDDGTGNEPCTYDPNMLPACNYGPDVLLPDLMTVVPKHLSIQNEHQREMLRFSNGIANVGEGPFWLEPEYPDPSEGTSCQAAYQLLAGPDHFEGQQIIPTDEQIPAPIGTYAARCEKGSFDYHETHNHWHIDNVGELKVCTQADFDVLGPECPPALTAPGQPTVGIKFTFCLIDWYKLGDNTPNSDPTRNFFACGTGFQGISPGWVDQYHHTTPGQEVDITGIPAGDYVLVSTVNMGAFEEEDTTNNSAWVRFHLGRDNQGNPNIEDEVGSCDESDYLAMVTAAVDAFVGLYHPGDSDFAADVVDEMCGGKGSNK